MPNTVASAKKGKRPIKTRDDLAYEMVLQMETMTNCMNELSGIIDCLQRLDPAYKDYLHTIVEYMETMWLDLEEMTFAAERYRAEMHEGCTEQT